MVDVNEVKKGVSGGPMKRPLMCFKGVAIKTLDFVNTKVRTTMLTLKLNSWTVSHFTTFLYTFEFG